MVLSKLPILLSHESEDFSSLEGLTRLNLLVLAVCSTQVFDCDTPRAECEFKVGFPFSQLSNFIIPPHSCRGIIRYNNFSVWKPCSSVDSYKQRLNNLSIILEPL